MELKLDNQNQNLTSITDYTAEVESRAISFTDYKVFQIGTFSYTSTCPLDFIDSSYFNDLSMMHIQGINSAGRLREVRHIIAQDSQYGTLVYVDRPDYLSPEDWEDENVLKTFKITASIAHYTISTDTEASFNVTLDSLAQFYPQCDQNSVELSSEIPNPHLIELSENYRSVSLSLTDLKQSFSDVLSRIEFGHSSLQLCGQIELNLVENRNEDGSPYTFVVLDKETGTLDIWCDHTESIGTH